jgi:formylmethanofuran dehydrogenase subunit E
MSLPDNYDLFVEHDAMQEKRLAELPECCECGERIQDEYCFEINGEYICEQCLNDNHRKYTEDVMG